tara:strand:- start:106 stop:267 length:162 start_codon:yes stop_codon:yes gene_type:complete
MDSFSFIDLIYLHSKHPFTSATFNLFDSQAEVALGLIKSDIRNKIITLSSYRT